MVRGLGPNVCKASEVSGRQLIYYSPNYSYSAVNYRCMEFAVENDLPFSLLVNKTINVLSFICSFSCNYREFWPMRRDRIPRGSERSDSAASSSGCTKRAKSRYPEGPRKRKNESLGSCHYYSAGNWTVRMKKTTHFWIILFLAERAKHFSQVGRFEYKTLNG